MTKILSVAALFCALTACNRGLQSKEAIRQGVVDHLAKVSNLNISMMNVDVTSVVFRGNQADAVVSFTPRGGSAGQGMTMNYTLEQKGNQWVVVGRADSGQNPHGGAGSEAMPNPHGTQPPAGELPPGHPSVDEKK
jgi:hypothetical protein